MCVVCTGSIGSTGATGGRGLRGFTGATGAAGVQVINRRVKRQAGCPGDLRNNSSQYNCIL